MAAQDIDDNLGDFGDLVSVELFLALTDTLGQSIDGVKVGEIAPMIIVEGMTPALDPSVWQKCVGGTVTDSRSPIFGQAVPDLRDRYLKAASTLSEVGNLAGEHSLNFTHVHGGRTNNAGPGGQANHSNDVFGARAHSHALYNGGGVPSSEIGVVDLQPRRFHIEHYLKIR